jgi:ABC-type Mn2+/Zn2+ transport system permease subunit
VNLLLDPLRFEFMRTGLLAAALVGIACASLGVYVVLRRMAFIGDALAHTILPGVVGAYLLKVNLLLGALVAGLLTALGIGWFSRRGEVREDTAIGIMFTGMFALGILMMSTVQSFRDFTHILFGNILGVTGDDLALITGVCVLILVALWLFSKELELTSYDPVHSEVIGLRTDWVRYGLLVLLALTVITGIQVVGVVLTSALLITPAAAAALLTNRLSRMVLIASAIAVGSGVAGLYLSYYFAIASGAAIVLICTLGFAVAWVIHQLRRPRGAEEAE